jgi:hypothetical protein
MNEAKFRERVHQAVGEARFPEYLPSRVEARLKHPGRDRSPLGSANGPLLLGLGRIGSLVAALLVVLLIAALVVGASVWRNSAFPKTLPAPAGHDLAVKQFQAATSADLQSFVNTQNPYCYGPSWADAACLAQILPRTAALQGWLDDLNRTQPPARFADVVALMHRHLTLALAAQAKVLTAFKAKDDQAFVDAGGVTVSETEPLAHEAVTIIDSRQATIAQYKAFIRSDMTYLLACGGCELLMRQDQVVCDASRTQACVDEFAALRLQLETFVSDLAFAFAPDSLSAEDAKLQADLMGADVALDVMESAASSRDQVGLQAGHDQLLQALRGVEADAGDIAARG